MHMIDALISPYVGGVMTAVSAGAVGLSVAKIKNNPEKPNRFDFDEKKIPVMAVMGAFVFAAQMINFSIPGTGSSGHIGGGILLAAILGPFPALLTLASVLLIQCLFFADGGLLAYGCNLFNLGVLPCFLAYGFIYKPIIKKWGLNKKTISAAAVSASIAGLQAGAFGVVLQTSVSGVASIPFGTFIVLMQPIHLAIGVLEGIITAAVLCFIYGVRPEILDGTNGTKDTAGGAEKKSVKKILLIFIAVTLILGGALAVFSSELPDGLEWAIEKATGRRELENPGGSAAHEAAESIVSSTAAMPDYDFAGAGIIGSVITVILAGGTGFVIHAVKKRGKKKSGAL